MSSVKIIAEVGSNYDGDLENARNYIRGAKRSGADIVKFQTLRRDKLVAKKIWVDGIVSDNPVYPQFINLPLPDEWHFLLKQTADEEGIEFISTPFYLEAVDLLEKVGVRTYKIASGDICFRPLLEAVGRTGKCVILSTGCSSLSDVEQALDILTRSGAGEIVLLHCVSNYPPQWQEMNLRAIVTLRETFGLPVGISDHSQGCLVPIVAASLGATVIEKHVTFDRARPGPDHPYAMTMEELAEMVDSISKVGLVLGDGRKIPSPTELIKQRRIRRGLYHPGTGAPFSGDGSVWLRPQY